MTGREPPIPHLWVVGAGRLGLALGLMLHRGGAVVHLTYSSRRPAPPDHPLFRTPPAARFQTGLDAPGEPPSGVVLAVPDDAIPEVAAALASGGLPRETPVLHLSGVLGAEALAPLADAGCSTASLHPLVSVPAPDAAERLLGAWYAVEGTGAALSLAERIAGAAGGRVLSLRAGSKPLYHAAAVFASNYLVALLAVSERLLGDAGVSPEAARAALSGLAAGAVADVAALGPVGALTGPVARGDADTLALHRERLSGSDAALYSLLAGEALSLAREQGLDAELARRIEQLLGGGK